MVRAGALLYAIFIAFIISAICGSLSLIYLFLDRQVADIDLSDRFDYLSEIALNQFLNAEEFSETFEVSTSEKIRFELKPWGAFNFLKVSLIISDSTRFRCYMTGRRRIDNRKYALYMTNLNHQLGIVGNANINGDCFVPQGKLKNGFENGFKFTSNGISVKNSESNLTNLFFKEIKIRSEVDSVGVEPVNYDLIEAESKHNSFDTNTMLISFSNSEVLRNITLSGNFKIFCKETLTIESNCELNDVLIEARKVIVKKGFDGSIQIFATDSVLIEEDVTLSYPSCIVLSNTLLPIPRAIEISKGVNFHGDIITGGKDGSMNQILVSEGAKIFGQIISAGQVELKGEVNGSIMTQSFILKSPATNYPNILINPKINIDGLKSFYSGTIYSVFSEVSIVKELN